MKHTGITLPGYRFDKTGKLVKSTKGMSVSRVIAQKKSKRVRVVKTGTAHVGPK